MNSKLQTTCVYLEKSLSKDISILLFIFIKLYFWLSFANTCKLLLLVKDYVEVCYLGWKTPGENTVLSIFFFFATIQWGRKCLFCEPTWVSGSHSKQGNEWRLQVPDSGPVQEQNPWSPAKIGPLWGSGAGALGARGPSPDATALCSKSDLLSSSPGSRTLAEALIWHVIGTQPRPRMCPAGKGMTSSVPFYTNIQGPSVPGGIKRADKPITYRSQPKVWECRAGWAPDKLVWSIQIS